MFKMIKKIQTSIILFFIYLRCLVISTKELLLILLTREDIKGSVKKVDIEGMSSWQVFFLSHMVTMTPGTTVCEISEYLDYIEVFTIFDLSKEQMQDDIDVFKKSIKRIFS